MVMFVLYRVGWKVVECVMMVIANFKVGVSWQSKSYSVYFISLYETISLKRTLCL